MTAYTKKKQTNNKTEVQQTAAITSFGYGKWQRWCADRFDILKSRLKSNLLP